ncbi:MAG TPA: hypothetical protein VMV18_01790 [bacterium]|nr:hypothetical protein [bacterium]
MERRILGAVLSFAHFFIAMSLAAVAGFTAWGVIELFAGTTGMATALSRTERWLPFLVMFLLLFAWWMGLFVWALRVQQRITILAMEGRHAEASERIRRFRDNETILRLIGVNGSIWRRAHVVEAYAHLLHGLPAEALAIALPESKGIPTALRRTAALVAASAASEQGDLAVFDELRPWLERAAKTPRNPYSQQLLAVEGLALGTQLKLAEAEKRAEWLLSLDPRSRLALSLRALTRALRGDFACALADNGAATAAVPEKGSQAQRVFLRQNLDVARCALLRELGRMDEALALVKRIREEGPRHRLGIIAVPAVEGLAAALRGDAAGAEAALAALREASATTQFDHASRARVALSTARIERARGEPARAVSALADAIASPNAAVRQEALVEQAQAKAALGDAAGARASCDWAIQLSGETVHAARAREILAARAP